MLLLFHIVSFPFLGGLSLQNLSEPSSAARKNDEDAAILPTDNPLDGELRPGPSQRPRVRFTYLYLSEVP